VSLKTRASVRVDAGTKRVRKVRALSPSALQSNRRAQALIEDGPSSWAQRRKRSPCACLTTQNAARKT
jgi:hypothetical protein